MVNKNRRRNLYLNIMYTKDERDLIKKVAKLKGITVTDMLLQYAKNEYQKLIQK